MSATVLDRILAETRVEVRARKLATPLAVTATERPPSFRQALEAPGMSVIAEFKRRSPSAGSLHEAPDLGLIVDAYVRGGASAISVLTEGPNFDGSLADLTAARARCALPLLRKDFIIDPYQLDEAVAAGADAVLLIVAALEQAALAKLHAQARELALDVLVEVHDGEELGRALDAGAETVGINNRDLRDLSVDVGRTETLLQKIPPGVTVVSESGFTEPEQIRRLEQLGVDGVLIGESLMRAADPAAALGALRRAGS